MDKKEDYLKVLSCLSPEALRILADLAKKPGVEQKLIKNEKLIKGFL